MRDEIYWVVDCTVRPGKFTEYKKIVKDIVAATKLEDGSVAYDYSVNADETKVQIFECYKNSEAIAYHVTNTFAPFADAFLDCVSIDGFVVYGKVEGQAKEILDGFGSQYFMPFEGFISK